MDVLKNKITLSMQKKILDDCFRKDMPLAEILTQKGLNYDSLRYCDYSDIIPYYEENEILDDKEKLHDSIPAVSF